MFFELLPEIIFYPVAWLFGYLFLLAKFRDSSKRKEILRRDYKNSYATAGLETGSLAVIGIFAIVLAVTLVGTLVGLIYVNFFK